MQQPARKKIPLRQQIRIQAFRGLRQLPAALGMQEAASSLYPQFRGFYQAAQKAEFPNPRKALANMQAQLHAVRMYSTKQAPTIRVDAKTKDLGAVFQQQHPQVRLKVTPKSYVPAGHGYSFAPGRVLLPTGTGGSAALYAHELGHLASNQRRYGKFLMNLVPLENHVDLQMMLMENPVKRKFTGLASRGLKAARLLTEYDATRRGLKFMQKAGYSAKEVAGARKMLLGALGTYAAPQFPRITRTLQRIHTARRRYGKIKGLFKTLAKVR